MHPNERTRESVQTLGLATGISVPVSQRPHPGPDDFEKPVDVKAAAEFLGVSASLVYAYVERKQIPHFRMMGRAIRFRLSELNSWRQQFHVNGGING
jgi:excisionase family DNA binding protein